jgi:uncharacterized protein YndB with AHSA1/START domain
MIPRISTKERKRRHKETIELEKSIFIDAAPEVVFNASTDPEELTRWFPDQAILEPRVGGKMKSSFYNENSDHTRAADAFPEATVKEFIPIKKLSYTWQHKDVPEFPEIVVTWELE